MLDIKFISACPEDVKRGLASRGLDGSVVDRLAEDYRKRNDLVFRADNLKKERNALSRKFSEYKKEKKDPKEIIGQTRALSEEIDQLDGELKEIGSRLHETLLAVPNLPLPEVPVGLDPPRDNKLIRTWGERADFAYEAKAHWDVAAPLELFDSKRGGKIAGAFFLLYVGWGARLQRALINFMLDLHGRDHGYREVWPPFLVRRETMIATGQLPSLESDMYRIEQDDLFPIPTAEVPVTNIHRDEILREDELPIRYVAYTPCFRREAGSYGKDTRGLIRVHQFEKVEMVKFCRPEESEAEHESLLENAEKVLQLLGLEYQVVLLCTGDLSFSGAKCYDLEAYAPGLGRFLEVSSVTNYMDFQARRGNIRYRDANGKIRLVHTINGSGLAIQRVMACLLETYQQEDGSVRIPEVLRPYLGGHDLIQVES
ncbi:MAG: serine--tRNA ligase [Planctomycetota bacterium]|nr:serine--tRNA ligase [Planctomycetota bacterium]